MCCRSRAVISDSDNIIRVAKIALTFSDHASVEVEHIRGAIAELCPENDLLHQHTEDGLVYRYPLVQYRCGPQRVSLVGFNAGAEAILRLDLAGRTLKLGTRHHHVSEAVVEAWQSRIQFVANPLHYRMTTPMLLLNQNNYQNYKNISPQAKRGELDRLIIAHLLRAAKGLGIWLDERIGACMVPSWSRWLDYKGQKLLAFQGEFIANLELPPGLALGKGVSLGFGQFELV